ARRPSRSSAKRVSSAMTACSGRCTRHSATSSSTLLPAASTLARSASGWRAITSSAEAPIEPVAPNTATRCIRAGCIYAASEAQPGLAQREHRQRGQYAVDAVQHAAVAGDQGAGVLHRDMALEQAL